MAERLPFGEIRPGARPIGAFIQPGQKSIAGAARPQMLSDASGVNSIQRARDVSVEGYNEYAQVAEALAPFSRQLSGLLEKGIMAYAEGKIDEGYRLELKNQQARAALSLQLQQEAGAAQAAGTISRLQKVDPPAAQMLAESNPWKAIGRRRALAQMTAGEVDNVLADDLAMNGGQLSALQPGSPQLMQRKAQLTQKVFEKYGLTGEELEAQYYVVPKLNKAWDDYSAKQRTLYHQQLQVSSVATTTAAIGQLLQGYAQNGIPFNGRVYSPGDPEFAQLAGSLLTLEIDKSLSMFGGKDKVDAVKQIREQLVGAYGQVPVLADALSFVQGGSPGDKVRPTWGASNPLEMLELRNRGGAARVQQYELGQKTVSQQLDGLWWKEGMPGSMLPTDPRYPASLINFRNQAGAMGYRDIDGYMKGRMDSQQSVVGQAYAPDPLAAQDFMNEINDLPPSTFSSPQGMQRVREQARQAARSEPTRELQAARYKEYIAAIEAKQKSAEEFTPGVKQDVDRALLQDLGLPAVKALIDQGKGNQNMFQTLLQGGADPASAAASALGSAAVSAFTTRLQNLYVRNVENEITQWREKNPGRALTPAAKNVLVSQAIANTRKSQEYTDAYETLTGKKPGEVGPKSVGTGPSQGTAPGPLNRGVPRSAAGALPDSTVKGFQARPVMDGSWLHGELSNVANGKAVSPQLYQLAKRAGTTTNRYLLEQLRFYPQLDPQGEARKFLEGEVKKQRQGETVSSANYQGFVNQDRAAAPFNPLAPGSWLMGMLAPPAAAATLPPGYDRFAGGGGGDRPIRPVLGDKGGLAATVMAGEGGWNSVNYGTTGSASQMALTSMTIGQVEDLQKRGRVFAVGAYQFTPGVLARARRDAGLSPNDQMTPQNQTRLFWGLALGGKRPALAAYLRGESNDINAAHQEISMEWAGVAGPSGRGYYDGDSAGNKASIGAARVRQALIAARKQLSGR
jgi:hypothetical protein